MKRRNKQMRDVSNEMLFAACEQLITHQKDATEIAEWLKEKYAAEVQRLADEYNLVLTREKCYPLLREAFLRKLVFLHIPEELHLAKRIRDYYHVDDHKTVKVIDVRPPPAPDGQPGAAVEPAMHTVAEKVAQAAAEVLVGLIKQLGHTKESVHLGFGAGRTTFTVAGHLAHLLQGERDCPNLVLHALTSGFEAERPLSSPVAFFPAFDQARVQAIGLFAPAIVFADEYDDLKNFPGIRESFARAGEIDIVVTSLARAKDQHGLLNRFLGVAGERATASSEEARQPPVPRRVTKALNETRKVLEASQWVGDVAFLPFSHQGPIVVKTGLRAMTLFELPELVRLAATPDKYVVLVAGPCGTCGTGKANAIKPLLERQNENLHIWNYLITDKSTAGDLLPPERASAAPTGSY